MMQMLFWGGAQFASGELERRNLIEAGAVELCSNAKA